MMEVRMRFSLLASACTTAVLSTLLTLPLLAQPAPKQVKLVIAGNGKHSVPLHCKDVKDLSQCIDIMHGLSPKELKRLKKMAPELQKKLDEALSKTKDRSGRCFALKVYEFPKGYPEKNTKARAKVSDCTSASLVKEKPLEKGKKARVVK
jgi:hypothetical protein